MKRKITLFLASGFGLGFVAPFAPGTFGSLPGVALAFAVALLPLYLQIPVCAVLTLLAVGICDRAEKMLKITDDSRIAADEWMLFPIALVGLPIWERPWWMMAIFFVVVRFIDIIKPYPANRLQSLPGGRGIVADDFVANLYALGINWAIYAII